MVGEPVVKLDQTFIYIIITNLMMPLVHLLVGLFNLGRSSMVRILVSKTNDIGSTPITPDEI